MSFDEIIALVRAEHARQVNLPGSEWDVRNTPNDWAAIATHYVSESIRRAGNKPDKVEYLDSMIKATVILIVSLEYLGKMSEASHFREL